MENIRTIVVLIPERLSQAVRTVPALRHLRVAFQTASIMTIADESAGGLLTDCPFVDRVISANDLEGPLPNGLASPDLLVVLDREDQHTAANRFFASARHVLSWRSENRRSSGDERDQAGERDPLSPEWPARLSSEARMLRLVRMIGDSTVSAELALWPRLIERSYAASLLSGSDAPIAVIHAGGGREDRRWRTAHWGFVVEMLQRAGIRVFLVGTASDDHAIEEQLTKQYPKLVSLVGRTSVSQLAGVIERADLFVGIDSGPAVLAQALRVPGIVIGPQSMLEYADGYSELTPVDGGVCHKCGSDSCTHELGPARDVLLEPVLAELSALLHRPRLNA